MSTSRDDKLASMSPAPDPIAALRALSACLRHLACGYGLDPHERTAALTLLAGRIPGVAAADLDVTRKSVAPPRRISGRRRERAGELCVRLAECAEALRKSEQ